MITSAFIYAALAFTGFVLTPFVAFKGFRRTVQRTGFKMDLLISTGVAFFIGTATATGGIAAMMIGVMTTSLFSIYKLIGGGR